MKITPQNLISLLAGSRCKCIGFFAVQKKGRHNMNLKALMYKLQTALLCKGVKVKINQFQSYSEESKRMITKYVLTVPKQEGDKIKNEKLLESYRLSEVVQKLAELLRGGSG